MAGSWIKMRVELYRDPKVCAIAESLMSPDSQLASYISQNRQADMCVTRNVMRNVTVGALLSVWGVMRTQGHRCGDDLLCKSMTRAVIDDITEIPGFGDAMLAVGWVEQDSNGIVFPRFFEEHNVDPAETAQKKNAERQRRFREKQREENNVTANVTVTHREDKRRDISTTNVVDKRKRSVLEKPESVRLDVWEAFKALRKAKRAALSQIALDGIERESRKAGIDMNQALTICCERGWQSFKAEWISEKQNGGPVNKNAAAFASYTTIIPQESNNGRTIDVTPRLG